MFTYPLHSGYDRIACFLRRLRFLLLIFWVVFVSYVSFGILWDSQKMRNSIISSQYFTISDGINHYLDCPSDDFYFISSLFPEESEPDLVEKKNRTNAKAKAFEILLQGSLCLYPSVSNFPLSIYRDNSSLAISPEFFVLNDIDRKQFFETEPMVQHVILALAVPEYTNLLRFFQMGNDWGQWYKIIETITNEYPQPGGKGKNISIQNELVIDSNELKRFKYSANSIAASGLGARHGFNGQRASGAINPMDEDEAYRFVVEIVHSYAQEKVNKYKNWR